MIAVISATAHSADKADIFSSQKSVHTKVGPDPLKHYFSAIALGHFWCEMSLSKAMDSAGKKNKSKDDLAFGNYRICIEEHSEAFKFHYVNTSKLFSSNKAVSKELKEHYILALDQLQGIIPGSEERVIDYERRTEAQKRATAKQKLRVEAELP